MNPKKLLTALGFTPKEKAVGILMKKYQQAGGYCIEVDLEKEIINYGKKIKSENKTTQNFSQLENFVVLECINRLLEKGYKPENIVLEKTWGAGHGTSGRLDICVTRDDGSEYLLIECKTHGKEFDKEFARMKKDGGQLFTYFKFSNKADVIMLYASELKGKEVVYRNEIVKIEDDYRTGDTKDFYEKWNKLTKDNGVFDTWVKPYNFESKALTPKQLVPIEQEDSGLIFNQFLEILRHNVVSDKPNAFNKIFTLFLCKVYDEKNTKDNEELKFQWLDGIDKTTGEGAYVDFLIRLSDLYKNGMLDFLEKEVTDFSEDEFNKKYGTLDDSIKKELLKEFNKIRLEKNNEFAIKEVFDHQSFLENAKIVKEVVELLQGYRIRYNRRQQYLSDFFEKLLTTGLKQEAGQFFTPVPIAQFIIKSLPIDTIVNQKLEKGEKNNLLPYVIDYASGSGHFLTESMHEIQALIDKKKPDDYINDTATKIKGWHNDHFDWATQYVYGIEKDYRLVKVGKVGCYLHGDGLANVILSDGLASFNHSEYKLKLKNSDSDFPKENKQFDVLLSNPPYSVSAFKNASTEYYSEKDFDLYTSLTASSSEIECLFIERTKQLLKDGGIAGIILPSSILSNEGIYTKAREIILQNFEIVAIAELGSNTFMATGTNTVVLFLRRVNNYHSINLRKNADDFFINFQDVTLNKTEKPFSKYVQHVWETISFDDYVSLIKNKPNKNIENHEFYKSYRKTVEEKINSEITAKKKNRKTILTDEDVKKIKERIEKECWNIFTETEKEKIHYFVLAYPQQVVLIKTGEKDAEKRFLGYEFSNRRGSEGIHPIQRGKSIGECTKLFDEEIFDNPEKASTYIYKAFLDDYEFPIHESFKNNISRVRLVDMITFDRAGFAKNISTAVKKKVKIESKWEVVKLDEIIELVSGQSPESEYYNQNNRGLPFYQGKTEFGDIYLKSPACWTEKTTKESIKGDVLMSVRAPVGPVNLNPFEKICIGRGLNALRATDKIYSKYLFYYLHNNQEIIAGSEGAIFQSISREQILSIKIPLPPLKTQQKIVSEIEVLEKKEKMAKGKIAELKKNIDNTLSIKSKEKYKVADILTLEYGSALPENNRVKGEFPVMGSNGIVGYHNEFIVEGPTIVIGRKGSAGKVTWIEKNSFPIDTTFYVRLIDDQFNLKLVYYALQKMNLEKLSGGTGVPGLNRNDAYSKVIPLPPLSEQKKIVSQIEKIEVKIAEAQKIIDAIPAQKNEVLKKYL